MKKILQVLFRWRVVMAWCTLVAGLVALSLIVFRFVDYSLPMMRGDYNRAVQSVYFGDMAMPHYNQALADYELNDYESARKGMEKALSACMGSDGQLKESHRFLASQCQFYIGNCFFNTKKTSEAAATYEECLKLYPPHMWAKYNLEKLQETQPQSPQGGQGGKPAKKI